MGAESRHDTATPRGRVFLGSKQVERPREARRQRLALQGWEGEPSSHVKTLLPLFPTPARPG